MLAYIARYGRQPISEIRALTRFEALVFQQALSDLVEAENKG